MEVVNKNLGDYNTRWRQWVLKAKDLDADCTQDVPLVREDGKENNMLIFQVKQGHCAAPTPACSEGMIQNLALDNCKCEAMPAVTGKLVDLSKSTETAFAFQFGEVITVRQWAEADGMNKWTNPTSEAMLKEWLKCFTFDLNSKNGKAHYDSRFIQVELIAAVGDCRTEIVRTNRLDTTETQTLIAQVWPEKAPELKHKVFNLDVEPMVKDFEVEAGSTFFVQLEEFKHFPNGFAWAEPTVEFKCAKVISKNFGEYNSGYRVWMMEAKTDLCQEEIFLRRPEGWPATMGPKQVLINVNVVSKKCEKACEVGKKYTSPTSCDCIEVETKVPVGQLFVAHDIAVGATVRVMLDMKTPATS